MPQMREAMMIAGSIAALGGGLEASSADAHPFLAPRHPLTHHRMEPVTAKVELFDAQTGSFSVEPPTDGSVSIQERCTDSTGYQTESVLYKYSPQPLGKCAVGDKVSISGDILGEHLPTQHFTVHKRPIHAVFLERLAGVEAAPVIPSAEPAPPVTPPEPTPAEPAPPVTPPEPTPPSGGDQQLPIMPAMRLWNGYAETEDASGNYVANNGTVENGQIVQWSVTIENDSAEPISVRVADEPPKGESFIPSSLPSGATIDPVSGDATWTVRLDSNYYPTYDPTRNDEAQHPIKTIADPDRPCGQETEYIFATATLADGLSAESGGLSFGLGVPAEDYGSTSNAYETACNNDTTPTS